jgi:nucleoside-diphosphate-sugar epimerase
MSHKALPIKDLEAIGDRCQRVWQSLHNARLFITGGTGFFGRWLLESFAYANDYYALNAKVTVLSRDPQAFCQKMPHLANHPAIGFIQGDVRDFIFPQEKYTHVIHAATEASATLNRYDPIKMFDVIVKGSQRSLDFAHVCGATNILLVSSGAVYGKQPSDLTHVSETFMGSPDIAQPSNAYALAKRSVEHLATLYHAQYGLNIKIARCFAFVGPGLPLDQHFAIGNFIQNALNGDAIEVKSDGSAYRSYQYAADLSVWLWHIFAFGEANAPYNVGSDQAISIKALADTVAACVDPVLAVNIAQKGASENPPERYVPSIERAQKTLALTNEISLSEALKKTYLWHRKH